MVNQYRELFFGEVGGWLTWAGGLPITLVRYRCVVSYKNKATVAWGRSMDSGLEPQESIGTAAAAANSAVSGMQGRSPASQIAKLPVDSTLRSFLWIHKFVFLYNPYRSQPLRDHDTRSANSLYSTPAFLRKRGPATLGVASGYWPSAQLYFALYLGLIPINATIQTEIVPVVSCSSPAVQYPMDILSWWRLLTSAASFKAPLLCSHRLCVFPGCAARIHDSDVQRRPGTTRFAPEGDWAGENWATQGQCGCGLDGCMVYGL